jgi:hypothetical protein
VRGAGCAVRFQSVSREEAEKIRRADYQELLNVISNIRVVSESRSIDIEALYNQNLIDGMIDANA